MLIYTHRCPNCGAQFTKKEAFFDEPVKRCPKCQTGIVQCILQRPFVVFKSFTWYATDPGARAGRNN